MERKEGVKKLKLLIGKDIRQLVDKYGVSFEANRNINKGWFGHTWNIIWDCLQIHRKVQILALRNILKMIIIW